MGSPGFRTGETRPVRRREAIKHSAAAVFVVVFAVGQYVVRPSTTSLYWWADIAWTLAALLAGVECLRAARGLSGDQRRAWLFFAAGCLAWLAGMLVWDYRELIQQEITPFPDYSDVGFMALPPLFVVGLMYMSAMRGLSLTLKDAADLGVIVAVVAFGTWLLLAEPLRNPGLSIPYRGVAFTVTVLNVSAFLFALLAVLRHAADPNRVVLLAILAALGLHAVTDSLYSYSLLENTYQAGDYLDVFWIIAFALTYCAAVIQQSRGPQRGEDEDEDGLQVFNARMRRADTVVFTSVLLLVGIAAYWGRHALAEDAGMVAPFLAALAVFLGLREWANHRIQLQLISGIRSSERELHRILEYLDDTYYRSDLNGVITAISPSVTRLMGYTPREMIGRAVGEFNADASTRPRLLSELDANGGVVHNFESQVLRKDGRLVSVSTNAHYVRDDDGNAIGVEGTSRDVSQLRAAEDEMRKLSGALRQSADAVVITDRSGVIEFVNPAFEATTGFAFHEVVGSTPRVLKSGEHDDAYYDWLWSTIGGGEVFRDVMMNKRKDGSLYYEDKTITPLLDDAGRVTHFVSSGKDISQQMQAQERLHFIAYHDVLTGLPNRTLLLDRAAQVLAHTRRHERLAALLFVDLDQFKNINDSLGHEVGDKLLVGVASRLAAELRPGDTVARFGGDEFVVLLDDIGSHTDITRVVEKLRRSLHTPISVDGISLHVSGTIGISVYPYDGEDGPTLLKNADNAMYRAKEQGRDTYAFYSEEMSTRVHERLAMEGKLRKAVDDDEFEVYYQPQIDIETNTICGVEALLRWWPAEGDGVGPAEFVPLLEDTGLIIPVGERVLRAACAQAQSWNLEAALPLELAVNISARQFTDSRFAEVVQQVLAETAFDPTLLQLEMTEGVYLRTTGANSATVGALDKTGIRLAIDDFGTGYSALNYLKRLPIQVLKIDRSFIRGLPDAADDSALTIATLAMARGLGLRVIAEGVETRAQLEFLREHGCRYVQGFLYSKPLPVSEMTALLRDRAFPARRLQHA